MGQSKIVALVGGTLVDGSGKEPVENATVLIDGTTIQEVGAKEDVKLPKDCEVIDLGGKTVMPGMMDLHVHISVGNLDAPKIEATGGGVVLPSLFSRPMPWFGIICFAHARASLEMGFTTLRDVGEVAGDYSSVALRDAVNSSIVEGPRIITSGPILTTTGGHADFMPLWIDRNDMASGMVVNGMDACLKAVRERIKMRTDWIKVFGSGGIMDPWNHQEFTDDELKVIVDEAHSKGKPVCAHLMYPEGALACVKAGVNTVEHGTILTEEVIELMLKKGTVLIPTLYATWSNATRGKEFGLQEEYVETTRKYIFEPQTKSFRMAYEAGVKIAMGTDCGYAPCPHGTNAKELELMMEYSGMSAMEAIVITTKNAAETLKMGDKLGTIQKGKLADIIVVDGNPLKDIKVLQDKAKISLVMKEGKIYVNRF